MDNTNIPTDNTDLMEEKPKNLIEEMYKDYFLDYASYVILERAIPGVDDGLKPVQRRILHAMHLMHDGRYHKVANVIGQTMQFHPHGDAAIGDALVGLGQKDLLIDCQGNWGDTRTGDRAAASRYIEARLSKFAQEVVFNPKTTNFQLSYDGRKKEPLALPIKFPLLLAQGVEGIAVGLSTKILPHNFCELIKGAIDILKGKETKILPDFLTGGMADFSNYNGGKRGGKVRVRARIKQLDRKTLSVYELPYGVTTSSLIDSIVKANNKNKIKIKKVVDNTARDVDIRIELPSGTSPEVTMDALYAFTDCEVSISPNACTIQEEKPIFTTVDEILKYSTLHTQSLLEWELKIRKQELEDKWHFASLERIFIEKRVYQKIEKCETWEEVIAVIGKSMRYHTKKILKRAITEDDIIRLTEIKIKRISKFNKFKADELIKAVEDELKQVEGDLEQIVQYTINYFQNLLKKFGKGKERKTEIISFDTVRAVDVVVNNAKLYINRKEGFIGYGLKKDEFLEECSDIDDILVFHKDGSYTVTKIAEKVFVGKYPLHVAVWQKGNERMIYNVIYADIERNVNYAKRFAITGVTRDRKYPIAEGADKAKILYFSANKNGEAETLDIQLTQSCTAKKKQFDFDFASLAVKGRRTRGNILSKYPIRKIKMTKQGSSTLGAIKIWFDDNTGRLNTSSYGRLLGEFEEDNKIVAFFKNGSYEMTNYELTNRFDPKELLAIGLYKEDMPISVVYYDGERKLTYAKRFCVETTTLNQSFSFLPNEHRSTKLLFLSLNAVPEIEYKVKIGRSNQVTGKIDLAEFVNVMGWKALGNKLSDNKLQQVKLVNSTADIKYPIRIYTQK
ncbi:MAG: DNA gyrase/topoisomerase IV subunit A [Saprospiraceae bacterium]|nr:DNA gyrase/topoisomerase IV subunit A [Saprospiraceae bacterium]